MEGWITTKEASGRWGISTRRINVLCKEGRIPGAYKDDGMWIIPSDAQKPVDKRMKEKIAAEATPVKKLPLPIGISDYRKTSTE